MASMTIRNLDDSLKKRLRGRGCQCAVRAEFQGASVSFQKMACSQLPILDATKDNGVYSPYPMNRERRNVYRASIDSFQSFELWSDPTKETPPLSR